MQRIRLAPALLASVILFRPPAASAQAAPPAPTPQNDMRDGAWRGWLQQSDQDSIRVTYVVEHAGKHILITLHGRSGVTFDMADAKVKDDVLTFDWPMGLSEFLYCRMSRRDGKSFEGTCNDRSYGQTGKQVHVWLQMTPPDTAR